MKFTVELTKKVNGIAFGTDRKDVRKAFDSKYTEMKKNIFSKNTMDAYKDFHVYFDRNDQFEAIEIFNNSELLIEEKIVFPGKLSVLRKVLPELCPDEYGGYIDKKNSVGVTTSTDNPERLESILLGCKDYYI